MSNNALIIAALIVAAYVLSQRNALPVAGANVVGAAPVVPGVTPGYYGTSGQWVSLAQNAPGQLTSLITMPGKAEPFVDGLDVYQPSGFQVPTIPPPMN